MKSLSDFVYEMIYNLRFGSLPTVVASNSVMKSQPTQDQIAARAYELWYERGRKHGNPEQDWYAAPV